MEKTLVLPDTPTMGSRFHLRAEGVEDALTDVGVTLRALADGPGFRAPSVEVVLVWEPLAATALARAGGWREPPRPGEAARA